MTRLDRFAAHAEAHDFATEKESAVWEDEAVTDPMVTTSLRVPKSLLDWIREASGRSVSSRKVENAGLDAAFVVQPEHGADWHGGRVVGANGTIVPPPPSTGVFAPLCKRTGRQPACLVGGLSFLGRVCGVLLDSCVGRKGGVPGHGRADTQRLRAWRWAAFESRRRL